jgi:hypothetical protein
VLAYKPDEKAVLGARVGMASPEPAERARGEEGNRETRGEGSEEGDAGRAGEEGGEGRE